MSSFRYALVGAGMMGQEHIRNIALIDGASVTAVVEPDPMMQAAVRALLPGAFLTADLDVLLARDDYDAVLIASPNHLHMDQLIRTAQARALPILVEKPLFTRPDEADAARRMAARHPAPLWVAMEYRYMPPIAAFVDRAAETTGGIRMLTIREHRFPFLDKVGHWNRFNASTGGTLVEKCCHHFDLMRLVLGAEPIRIMASAGQDENHLTERYGGAVPDILDNAYVIVDFEGGARAMLELCMFAEGARYQEEITAVGPKGRLEVRVPGPIRFWNQTAGPAPVARLIESPRSPANPRELEIPVDPRLLAAGDHNGATYYQHLRFIRAARGEGPVEVTAADGAAAVRMGMAAQRSAATGQAVSLAGADEAEPAAAGS